ncbi:hypothetical protein VVD37_02495 [Bacteroides fragilis]|uniref:hypothetical protein n=1 Tax=Bacteroides fragilis TaxID=817 RepID=UPI0032565156
MEKEKVGEGKIHIIILYRGNLSGRGKGFTEKGRRRSVCGRKRDVSRKNIAEGIGIGREIN